MNPLFLCNSSVFTMINSNILHLMYLTFILLNQTYSLYGYGKCTFYTVCFIINSGNVGSNVLKYIFSIEFIFFLCLLNYSANVCMFMWRGGLCISYV